MSKGISEPTQMILPNHRIHDRQVVAPLKLHCRDILIRRIHDRQVVAPLKQLHRSTMYIHDRQVVAPLAQAWNWLGCPRYIAVNWDGFLLGSRYGVLNGRERWNGSSDGAPFVACQPFLARARFLTCECVMRTLATNLSACSSQSQGVTSSAERV